MYERVKQSKTMVIWICIAGSVARMYVGINQCKLSFKCMEESYKAGL